MSEIQWKIRRFNELSLDELYAALQLRSEVFVVEQNCVYQDIDGNDEKAIHLLGEIDGLLVAYARLFRPNDYFEQASIGRVIVKLSHREFKMGHQLMQEAIKTINNQFGTRNITISAQLYLKKFYESHQFTQTSEMYLEDDIPHIEMQRS
jgi:ElaA protein